MFKKKSDIPLVTRRINFFKILETEEVIVSRDGIFHEDRFPCLERTE